MARSRTVRLSEELDEAIEAEAIRSVRHPAEVIRDVLVRKFPEYLAEVVGRAFREPDPIDVRAVGRSAGDETTPDATTTRRDATSGPSTDDEMPSVNAKPT
jgi:hypothetical protein